MDHIMRILKKGNNSRAFWLDWKRETTLEPDWYILYSHFVTEDKGMFTNKNHLDDLKTINCFERQLFSIWIILWEFWKRETTLEPFGWTSCVAISIRMTWTLWEEFDTVHNISPDDLTAHLTTDDSSIQPLVSLVKGIRIGHTYNISMLNDWSQ